MATLFPNNLLSVDGRVHSGRQALLRKDFAAALVDFEAAAAKAPNYTYRSAHFSEGVWTYLGRAQYSTVAYQIARQSLERAFSACADDHLARLYLGLAWMHNGEAKLGRDHLCLGLQSLYDGIEAIVTSRPFDCCWDRSQWLRDELSKCLSMLAMLDSNETEILSSAEWLGQEIEEEIDQARLDESRHR